MVGSKSIPDLDAPPLKKRKPMPRGYLTVETSEFMLKYLGIRDIFGDPIDVGKNGQNVFSSKRALPYHQDIKRYFHPTGERTFINLPDIRKKLGEQGISSNLWLFSPYESPYPSKMVDVYGPTPGRGLKQFGLENALPFGVDFVWQWVADANTPMSLGKRVGRATVTGSVGVVSGLATNAALKLLGVSLTGPWGWAIAIGSSIFVGATAENWATNWFHEAIVPTTQDFREIK